VSREDEDREPGGVAVIAGIRSQFIKLAGFQRSIERLVSDGRLPRTPIYVNAGQHYDDVLARQYLAELAVTVDVDLTVPAPARHPIDMTADMLRRLFHILEELKFKSDVTGAVVFGDANTTLAASIAARKAGLQLAHVEAGVRTFERDSPEEINRIAADALADLHFASTKRDLAFLEGAGLGGSSRYVGDLVRDLVLSIPVSELAQPVPYAEGRYALITLHREENTSTAGSINAIAGGCAVHQLPAVMIRHPRTSDLIAESMPRWSAGLTVLDSLPYTDFLRLANNAAAIITDSGALQRESYYIGRRCLIRQDNVFWPTLVDAGIHRSITNRTESVASGLSWLASVRGQPLSQIDDFGNGNAGELICGTLIEHGWWSPAR
jgi:UDP-N-acetylglucosamine 2-epimerase